MSKIQKEIKRLTDIEEKQGIADAMEVMQFFTDIMRGKVKDQFGLEASLAERAKAAQEVAKRTIDIDNRIRATQSGENTITIKLDWEQS
jgi:phage terminase small subunit